MSLFPINEQRPPVHLDLIKRMRASNQHILKMRQDIFKNNFKYFWCSPEVTKLILQELGTEASQWFEVSWKEQLALKELDPTWEFLAPPYPYTINEDGTVTLQE